MESAAVPRYRTGIGHPHPLGASVARDGVNFSLFGEHASSIELLLFEPCNAEPSQTIPLDPERNRTFHFWHVQVSALEAGAHYAWRVDGELRCDPRALGNSSVDGVRRSVVIDLRGYDWSGDRSPAHRWEDTVLYEMHVRGFTRSETAGVAHPGTFAGVVERIPYLQALGVTAVELLPAMDFDATTALRHVLGKPLTNYWGYNTLGFFAPHAAYCVRPHEGCHFDEFRDMVKALHAAGIEVILDVAFGADCTHPAERKLVTDALRQWVREGHVDGFRFGAVTPTLLWQISLDEELAGTKLIAGVAAARAGWPRWSRAYRDTIRRFVRSEPGLAPAVAAAITGSAGRINYVTCHDGFTLRDLVTYEWRHNEFNGEGNHDGPGDNLSWNCGEEGETSDLEILALRERQVRNFGALLMLSRGVPMLLAGDEAGRTQRGNNNAYCQDNPTNWMDWDLVARNCGMLRYWQRLIAFRKAHLALRAGTPRLTWHGTRLYAPGWNDPDARALSFTLEGAEGGPDLHVMLNMYWEPLEFEIPVRGQREWLVSIDTAEPSPRDIADPGDEPMFRGPTYPVQGRSVVVLRFQ